MWPGALERMKGSMGKINIEIEYMIGVCSTVVQSQATTVENTLHRITHHAYAWGFLANDSRQLSFRHVMGRALIRFGIYMIAFIVMRTPLWSFTRAYRHSGIQADFDKNVFALNN